jgi:hypothetical protein
VAAGFNSAGIANAAGAGMLTAEWIAEGRPEMDVWNVDIRRFGNVHKSGMFLRDRVQEVRPCAGGECGRRSCRSVLL